MDEDVEFFRQMISVGSLTGGQPSQHEYIGTKGLMLAVFEEAIRSLFGPPGKERTEAEAWVRSNRRSPFSFVTVCEVLGFDPDAVRRALPRLQGERQEVRHFRKQTRIARRARVLR